MTQTTMVRDVADQQPPAQVASWGGWFSAVHPESGLGPEHGGEPNKGTAPHPHPHSQHPEIEWLHQSLRGLDGEPTADLVAGLVVADRIADYRLAELTVIHRRYQTAAAALVEAQATAERERTLRRAAEYDATRDELTGAANRRWLRRHWPMACSGLILLDLDGFKQINDTYGHAAGDEVLIVVAGRIAQLRGDEAVVRLGGDEFAVLAEETSAPMETAAAVEAAVGAPIDLMGTTMRVGVSVGICPIAPGQVTTLPEVMSVADGAMYRVKAARHSGVRCGPVVGVWGAVPPSTRRRVWRDAPIHDGECR